MPPGTHNKKPAVPRFCADPSLNIDRKGTDDKNPPAIVEAASINTVRPLRPPRLMRLGVRQPAQTCEKLLSDMTDFLCGDMRYYSHCGTW